MTPYKLVILRTTLQSINQIQKTPEVSGSFEEGIYLSSPDLWKLVKKDNQKNTKLKETVLKYWLRSCSRCTPFGVFAGSCLVTLGDKTELIQNPLDLHQKKVRIDSYFFSKITSILEKDNEIRRQLLYYTNNSLYESFSEWRYAEYTTNDWFKTYKLTAVDKSSYLNYILQVAKNGATIDTLARSLQKAESVSYEDALEYLEQLCRAQILISDLEINVSGHEPLRQLIKKLNGIENIQGYKNLFNSLYEILNGPIGDITYYQQLIQLLEGIVNEKISASKILQVDTFISLRKPVIDKKIINKIARQMTELLALSTPYRNNSLNNFKNSFEKKFDTAEIPLAIAMDLDSGIGYGSLTEANPGGSEWVDELYTKNPSLISETTIDSLQQFVLEKYLSILDTKETEIHITDEDITKMQRTTGKQSFSNGMYILGSLTAVKNQFDEENFNFELIAVGGPSAVNLFTRFTHGHEQMLEFTKDIIEEEESQYLDVIFAEIIHLPDARTANVLLRPILRKYELPYVGQSGALVDNQIPIEDLMVSIQHNQVILRSIRHNKRVIPRLSSAHNYSNSMLPVYKFLCDIQNQGLSHPTIWNWNIISEYRFLPRVVYKNVIVSKARWIISIDDLKPLRDNKEEYLPYFYNFSIKYQVNAVLQIEADHKLLINLNHRDSVLLLVNIILKEKLIKLEECLTTSENCIVHDIDRNSFANEIIIPVKNSHQLIEDYTFPIKNINISAKFLPSSQWLYYKFYSGMFTQEKALVEHILPFIKRTKLNNEFEKFFFIRYVDDRPHIRLRFYNENSTKQTNLLTKINKLLEFLYAEKYVDSAVIETYVQEVQRYDPVPINEIESIFNYDSLAVLEIISMLMGPNAELNKIAISLRSVDMYLEDFGLSISEKYLFVKKQSTDFFNEFGATKKLKAQLNQKFKSNYKDIIFDVDSLYPVPKELEESMYQLKLRSAQNQPHINIILETVDQNEIKMEIVSNLIHLSINRMFYTNQRKYELIIYTFVERFYHSCLAREHHKLNKANRCIN